MAGPSPRRSGPRWRRPTGRRCRPRFTQYIPAGSDEAAWFTSFYLQDQWTVKRFTLSGALRYDNAQSSSARRASVPISTSSTPTA